ncbi:hypothetical protein C3V39_03790 [Prevotella sp. oral taxon 820]|nr:hypothetical protein C3V39_03790 [Prevotella sp. oral taxon 820]
MLENNYLCSINNNCRPVLKNLSAVVICLKTTIFVVSTTTLFGGTVPRVGCDLLENNYLCSINNNLPSDLGRLSIVVICLKTTIFVVSTTTQYL